MREAMNNSKVFVAGATGLTGSHTVRLLLDHGRSVRVLAHREDDRSKRLQDLGAEVTIGDLLNLSDVRSALNGVQSAYFVYPLSTTLVHTTVLAYMGPPRNVEECRNPDGRYIVTFDGVIDGNLIQIAMRVTKDAANKVESLRAFARPWPIVKLFREYMERNLRPDRVPDAMGASGNCIVKVKGRCWAARAGMTEPGTATPHAATSTWRSKCSKGRTGAHRSPQTTS